MLCITSTPSPIIDSIFELTLSKDQYFCARDKNSSELSTVIILPVYGNPLAKNNVLIPVKRPISKQVLVFEIFVIISKN